MQTTTESKAANVCAGEVSRQVQHIVDSALPLLLKAFDTDDDKEAVTAAVLGCGVILTGAGSQSCQNYMEAMATGSSMVRNYRKNTNSNNDDDDDDNKNNHNNNTNNNAFQLTTGSSMVR